MTPCTSPTPYSIKDNNLNEEAKNVIRDANSKRTNPARILF